MKTPLSYTPIWAGSCFKTRAGRYLIKLLVAITVVLTALFTATAIAANDVAIDNLNRVFNPTLNTPPVAKASVNPGALSTAVRGIDIAQQNITGSLIRSD